MPWQRGQDHDGLLEGIKLVERSSMKRQVAESRNSHNSENGRRESDPPPDKHTIALPRPSL
jgi:hypothetical protein